jgi:uncharacterized protein (UPF0276 family)
MKFAVNYSPQAADLFRQGLIVVDRFKCPNWDWMIEEARSLAPVYVHFDLTVGDASVHTRDWTAIERQLRETDTPLINLHPVVQKPATHSRLAERNAREAEQALRDVSFVIRRFGTDRVIVENSPLRVTEAQAGRIRQLPPLHDPVILSQVIRSAGVGLLLDLAHARLTCAATGQDVADYVQALPLALLREVHITGIGTVDGALRDHLALQAGDWALFDAFMTWIADGIAARPWLVAHEYGGFGEKFDWRSETAVLANDTVRLAGRVRQFERA